MCCPAAQAAPGENNFSLTAPCQSQFKFQSKFQAILIFLTTISVQNLKNFRAILIFSSIFKETSSIPDQKQSGFKISSKFQTTPIFLATVSVQNLKKILSNSHFRNNDFSSYFKENLKQYWSSYQEHHSWSLHKDASNPYSYSKRRS